MIVHTHTRVWRGGRRWLHNPRCLHCTAHSANGDACPCGLPWDEAPPEWREHDRARERQVRLDDDTRQPAHPTEPAQLALI